jgi:hypothetical protein
MANVSRNFCTPMCVPITDSVDRHERLFNDKYMDIKQITVNYKTFSGVPTVRRRAVVFYVGKNNTCLPINSPTAT